jgi:hypothetical protein
MRLSRRSFLAWVATLSATMGWSRARRLSARAPEGHDATIPPAQGGLLNAALIAKLGDVMLPSELGPAGIARVARAFTTWLSGYRAGVEVVHPYGSPEIEYTPASPAPRWRDQLAALDRTARERFGRDFASLNHADRTSLVQTALAGERLDRLPDPLGANHVAVALAAFYFTSPEANDLCYRARIGRRQCRPLVNAPREPLPLATPRGRP